MMDITELILFQHHEQRRMFALLDDLGPADAGSLTPVWERLAAAEHAVGSETWRGAVRAAAGSQ